MKKAFYIALLGAGINITNVTAQSANHDVTSNVALSFPSVKETSAFQTRANGKLQRFVALLNILSNPATEATDFNLALKEINAMLLPKDKQLNAKSNLNLTEALFKSDKFAGYTFEITNPVAFTQGTSASDGAAIAGKKASSPAVVKLSMVTLVVSIDKTFGSTTRTVKEVVFDKLVLVN